MPLTALCYDILENESSIKNMEINLLLAVHTDTKHLEEKKTK
jgi:hypothetical protein